MKQQIRVGFFAAALLCASAGVANAQTSAADSVMSHA